MNPPTDIHPFELFPRARLYEGISRKQFFDVLRANLHTYVSKENAFLIPELGLWEDEALYDLIPRILPGTQILPENNAVWAVAPDKSERVHLFEMEALVLNAFNQINGRNSLKKIAESLSASSELPFERAFRFTRGLFLTLVKAEVCLPINNPNAG